MFCYTPVDYNFTDPTTSLSNLAVFRRCGPSSFRFVTPRNTILDSISCRRISMARRVPCSPYPAARLYNVGRPSPTAVAPKATAFNTSVPRRIPPSMKICILLSMRNGAYRRISRRVRRGAWALLSLIVVFNKVYILVILTYVSCDRPPWLDRTIPCTPQ